MIKRFASYYKPHKKLFILDMICAIVVAALDLVFPMFSRSFIDDFIPNGKIRLIITFTILIIAMYIIRMICQFIMQYWGHVMGSRIEFDMRKDLFKHIQILPFKYFDDNKTGQIMSRLVGDLREIAETAHHGPEDIFIASIMIIGSFIILLKINVILTLVVFLFVILLILFTINKRKAMAIAFRNVRRNHADINAQLENSISGIRLSKSFANEEFEMDKFEINNMAYRESWTFAYKAMGVFSSGTHFLADMLNVVVISLGGILKYYDMISMGDLVAYLLYMAFMLRPVRRLIQFTQQFQSGIAGFERFVELMNVQSDIIDGENAIDLKNPKGEIKFINTYFRYGDKDEWVLEDVNLKIDSGKTIALVGPSGVGKTTISNLIPRFYEAQKGDIIIDNTNIKDIKLHSLRKNIGFVQQDVFIFWGTIRENILYGNPDATDREIVEAARKANIHEFIMDLKNGYDTIVGERGVKLSGGQKQRIAIARVFLKNPPILILDEATSSLDNATELAIQKSIEHLAKDRTTIIIAHRLSTIKNADEILVLTDNGIKEKGSHEELIKLEGIYWELYKAQFKGHIPHIIK
ncbi:MAG: ABC transporter ATP-binding protein/permease [Maledivibacter sp.]|jgi:ATP-binding cassette subfamily B protein|nr:ABC transporter ATP-binding protein/permease [Maledivibacter sp.]